MLQIQSLASGSKGNAVYICSDTTRILVDVGLTLPQLRKRCIAAGIDMDAISAVILTHEHCDHILGLGSFLTTTNAMLHIHDKVRHLFEHIPSEKIISFDGPFTIGDISVQFFPVPHDSKFCFGYNFTLGDEKISIATDLGRIDENIIGALSGSQIVMLECNHDLLRLTYNKKYPAILKQRITSSRGHLSNPSCAMAVLELCKLGTTQVILAHLSAENNSPTLAYGFVRDFLNSRGIVEGRDIWIDVATQDKSTVAFAVKKA